MKKSNNKTFNKLTFSLLQMKSYSNWIDLMAQLDLIRSLWEA